MNPNLLNYNYRPVSSSTIPALASSISSALSSASPTTRLNQVQCLPSTDNSINSGMINEMQSSPYLPYDDNAALLNFFIHESDNCSTMAPNQMASNDLITDQSHQQVAGTTNDHPYSRVERESRTDHQLTPINNYVSNSSNLQAGRMNSNSIGTNSHHSLHSHSTHLNSPHHPHSHSHTHPHHQPSPHHQPPLHSSHRQPLQQHSLSHHLLAPHSQSSHSVPHPAIHNYIQQSSSNHTLYNSNYLPRPSNMVNHGSPEQCRGLNSPNPSPSDASIHLIVNNDNSPASASPVSASTTSLLSATNSSSYPTSQSSQGTSSSQAMSSQKSDDLSQKANQSFNRDSDTLKLSDSFPPSLEIPGRLVEPPPPIQTSLSKPEVIDIISPSRPKEELKEDLKSSVPSKVDTLLPETVSVQFESVTILRVVHRLRYEGNIIAETVVNDHESTVPLGSIRVPRSELNQKDSFAISTCGQLLCNFPFKNTKNDGVSSKSHGNDRDRTLSKVETGITRKSGKQSSFRESELSSIREARKSTDSTSNTLTANESLDNPDSIFGKSSNKRKATPSSSTSNKKIRKHGKRVDEEKESKKGSSGDTDGKTKDRQSTDKKEELIDNEETRRATASVLLSLHGDSSLLRLKEIATSPEIIIDKIREPEFRPIEKDNQVFAKWARDKNFYPGKATSPQMDSKWLITFDDGEQRSVHESEIISIPYLVPGQQVMLTYTNDSCAQRVIKRCFVRAGVDVEYEVENDETRYPTRKLFLTSEMAAVLLGKQSKLPSNASKFADVDLNNIIPKRSRVSKPTTSSASSSSAPCVSSGASVTTAQGSLSHTTAGDEPAAHGDSDAASVNSFKSTKCRNISFSKQFLPSLSPSSNRSGGEINFALKTKKTSGKHPPPLPVSYKKGSDSSSSSSSCSSFKNERSSTKSIPSITTSALKTPSMASHQGEKEKLLGPIPPQGSTLFAGIGFLLTTIDRNNKSNGEMPSSEAGSSIPFDAEYLTTQIQMGSGKIFLDFDAARKCTEINESVLIAYTYLKSSLYMQCLHGGIPCVMHTWVIECCRDGQLLQKSKYLLPSGYSLIKLNLPADKNVFKKSAYLFKGVKIMIADSKLIDKWKPVLLTGSATIISNLPPSTGSSTRKTNNSVDFIVADANCPAPIVKKAQQMHIPIVTSEYLSQCLINGRRLSHDSLEEFKYK